MFKHELKFSLCQYIYFKQSSDKSLSGEMVAFANVFDGVIYFGITDYMEKAGTGIKRVTDACNANGNKCTFNFSDAFWVTMKTNNKDNVPDNVPDSVPDKRTELVLELIKKTIKFF